MFEAIIEVIHEIRKVRWTEVFIRFFLLFIFLQIEHNWKPFERVIQPEEWWLYKNPKSTDYVSGKWLFYFIIPFPMALFTVIYFIKRDKHDFMASNLAYSLSVGLNGIFTDILKITVGRPRPDFYYRCFPDGKMSDDMTCTNANLADILQGRKSFPSGHASFSFLSFSFIAFWLMGKTNIFNEQGRGCGTKLSVCVFPLLVALLISVSRTCDYHHHYMDVFVGSLIGLGCSYLCYRQYYPSLDSSASSKPYQLKSNEEQNVAQNKKQPQTVDESDETQDAIHKPVCSIH